VAASALLLVAWQPTWVFAALERVFPSIVWRVETSAPMVALSLDDGPDPSYTPAVLDLLQHHRARATFFLIAQRAAAHPALVARIRAEGHEVGNHFVRDGTTLFLSEPEFRNGLLQAERALGLTREGPSLFRPPGGLLRPAHRRAAESLGYRVVLGSAYPYDPSRPPATYMRWLVAKNLRPGAIVILHDAGGDRSRTLAALPGILGDAAARGLRVVGVAELMRANR
jgi:peptidoglycan/xylan/chitin deacetylase (PgdA/CDA1 family)